MKPRGKVRIKWSANFAYALGLLVTDGNLSPDGRHINFTSKDRELIENFIYCLKLKNKIGRKARGGEKEKKYFVVQFGDVLFYKFLVKIGITSNKSKKINIIKIKESFFFDFLRGHLDGDGSFYSYFDRRWRSSFMFYTEFVSASKAHILWLQSCIKRKIGIKGHISKSGNHRVYQLKYAKKESLKLFRKLYYNQQVICLTRKRRKIEKAFSEEGVKM